MDDYADIDKVLSELRHGHTCLPLNDNSAGGMTGLLWQRLSIVRPITLLLKARQARVSSVWR